LSGFGTVNHAFENQGHVHGEGNLGSDKITFSGPVSGRGSFTGNVAFTGTFNPGNSPARVALENVAFSSSALLNIELGGTNPGLTYDLLTMTGGAALDGTINFTLIDGSHRYLGIALLSWSLPPGLATSRAIAELTSEEACICSLNSPRTHWC
jgi:hypothetical protein